MLVFVSYRRDDATAAAHLIADRLRRKFGPAQVFMDIGDIALGEEFPRALIAALESAKVLIVIMGSSWRTNRSWDDGDFVLREIKTALDLGIFVLPVLVDDAQMPQSSDLPPTIQQFTQLNACLLPMKVFDDVMPKIEKLISDHIISKEAFQDGIVGILKSASPHKGICFSPEIPHAALHNARLSAHVPWDRPVWALLRSRLRLWDRIRLLSADPTLVLFCDDRLHFIGKGVHFEIVEGQVLYSQFPTVAFDLKKRVNLIPRVGSETVCYLTIGKSQLKQVEDGGFPIDILFDLLSRIRNFVEKNGTPGGER